MKPFLLGLLALSSTAYADLVMISGKIYDRAIIYSYDGSYIKTVYTPVVLAQSKPQSKNPEPSIARITSAPSNNQSNNLRS